MSLDTYKGAAWAFRTLMREAQDEIDRRERKGATVMFPKIIRRNLLVVRRNLMQIRKRA